MKIYFLSGMPRSGSTLLCNILAQNPRFHATATSGIMSVLSKVRDMFGEVDAFRAMPEEENDSKCVATMRGAIHGFFSDVEDKVIFEKSRGTEGFLEPLEQILGVRPKIICPVRDIRDVLASFEKLYRHTSKTRSLPDEKAFPFRYKTIDGRCDLLLSNEGGIVGTPINVIRDAVSRGWKDCLHFVDYDLLTFEPEKTMRKLYQFLGEPWHEHDFNDVKQVTVEDDMVYVYKNLHKIRPAVRPQGPQWQGILPSWLVERYDQAGGKNWHHFWQDL